MALPPILSDTLRLPIVASPMLIVSTPEMVIAQCTSGIIGSFPALNPRPQAALREWLARITSALAEHDARNPEAPAAPFAVNLIVHRSNDRLADDLATIVEFEVPIVITSLGARPEVNDAVHSYGGIVLHDVVTNAFARGAIDKGADGLVAVAAGAGGHAGTQSPFALVQEIRSWFDGPLLLSGAIANGRSVLAALAMGADLAYIGSAFIATEEANADDRYKQLIVDSGAADVVYSDLFTGVHGNYLRGSIVASGLDPDNLERSDPSQMDFGSSDKEAGTMSAKAWRDIWGSGQGIGAVDRISTVADLIDRLGLEFGAAQQDLPSWQVRRGSAPSIV